MEELKIDRSKVRLVYVGKPGCMCGCRGQYFTTPQYAAEVAEARGYALEEQEVNEVEVAHVLSLMEQFVAGGMSVELDDDCVFIDTGAHYYAAWYVA